MGDSGCEGGRGVDTAIGVACDVQTGLPFLNALAGPDSGLLLLLPLENSPRAVGTNSGMLRNAVGWWIGSGLSLGNRWLRSDEDGDPNPEVNVDDDAGIPPPFVVPCDCGIRPPSGICQLGLLVTPAELTAAPSV